MAAAGFCCIWSSNEHGQEPAFREFGLRDDLGAGTLNELAIPASDDEASVGNVCRRENTVMAQVACLRCDFSLPRLTL